MKVDNCWLISHQRKRSTIGWKVIKESESGPHREHQTFWLTLTRLESSLFNHGPQLKSSSSLIIFTIIIVILIICTDHSSGAKDPQEHAIDDHRDNPPVLVLLILIIMMRNWWWQEHSPRIWGVFLDDISEFFKSPFSTEHRARNHSWKL